MLSMLTIAAILACIALALNIGGNNSAAEMAPAYGAGARTKREALILVAIFSFIGACMAGDRVVHTLASGVVKPAALSDHTGAALVITGAALTTVGLANFLKLPIATSHATVGALVGFGLSTNSVYWEQVFVMVVWWLVTPMLALLMAYGAGKIIYRPSSRAWFTTVRTSVKQSPLLVRIFLTISGCFLAFSAGSNGLAKAIGPLVGTGGLDPSVINLIGGASLALGAICIGPRVLETVSHKITPVNSVTAVCVETICGIILFCATMAGIPISVAELVTCAVVGFSGAQSGIQSTWQNQHVNRIFKLWIVCPFLSAGTSYLMSQLL
jgi:sulfate permease